jgi:carbon monoxide dehydrogenase subunit G
MKISGSYEFNVPALKVWETLMDPQALEHCIPGCESFNPVGDGEYQAVVSVGVGLVQGRYSAKIALRDQDPHRSYRLTVEGSSSVGFANGEAVVTLTEQGDKTTVQVDSDAQVGGTVARVGQRLMGSVAKGMMDRFFGCLREAAHQ